LISKTYPRANARALLGAAVAGSTLGLGLAAAYLAGANAPAGLTPTRDRLASAAADGYSQVALQRANALSPGALAIAQRHDPFTTSGAPERDREAVDFAARLERSDPAPMAPTAASLMLRPALDGAEPAGGRFRFAAIGALESARDLECLTQAVYYEARGESGAGQAAVAQVVLNRVRHPAFPKTVCGVVFQGASNRDGCQFSFVCDGSMHGQLDVEAWRRAQHVASRALGGFVMADVGSATHFHAVRLGQQWGAGLVRVAQVGLHVFYRFGRTAPVYQAQADSPKSAQPMQVKAVYASLLPGPAARPDAAKADAKAEIPAEAQPAPAAEASKPVATVQPAATKPVAMQPAKADAPTA
jgi:spore germination cell wall hydrolase CwlJ-like protein